MLLAFWSGEELGLLGSAAFVAAPPLKIADIAAYLNFDMVGRMQDNKLSVQATGTSPSWDKMIEQANVKAGFNVTVQPDPYQPTDVSTFSTAGVPSLNFFTGAHADYHKPSDTADKIDYDDLDRIVDFAASIARRIEDAPEAPIFAKVEPQTQGGASRAGGRVFTGTVPDYATEAKGLLLGGELLCIDELSMGLAPLVVEQLGNVVARLRDEGRTMIIVEQSVSLALRLADEVIVLERGRVVLQGTTRELKSELHRLESALLGGAA